MRRKIMDYPDLRLDSAASWIRVRDEGGKVALAYKRREAISSDNYVVIEHETDVADFDVCVQILESIGLSVKSYQETWREEWWLQNGVAITFDEWPWLPMLCEVEGPDEESVSAVVNQLGVASAECYSDTIDGMYLRAYGIPLSMEKRTQLSVIRRFTFEEPPPEFLTSGAV